MWISPLILSYDDYKEWAFYTIIEKGTMYIVNENIVSENEIHSLQQLQWKLESLENKMTIFIPHDPIVVGYYGITFVVLVSGCHLSVIRPSIRLSVILFPDGKCQWIFVKLGVCIDIVKIWFGIAWANFVTF